MAFTLDKFLFCLELQLAGIICAWWGMIISALSVISIIAGLLFDRGNFATFLPFHVNVGGAFVSAVIMLIICLIYFYYSYQLLLGSNNVCYQFEHSYSFIQHKIHDLLVFFVITGKCITNVRLFDNSRYCHCFLHFDDVQKCLFNIRRYRLLLLMVLRLFTIC